MRLRSPTGLAGIFLAACALVLVGVALAAGGTAEELRPRLRGDITQQRQPAGHRQAQVARRGLAGERGHASPVAAARPARGGPAIALATAVAVSAPRAVSPSVGAVAEPGPPSPVTTGAPPAPAPPAPVNAPEDLPVANPVPAPSPAPAPPPPSPPAPPPPPVASGTPSAVYWGASIGPQLTGTQAPWDMGAVTQFEQIAGKQVSLVNFFAPFANCASSPCSFYSFPTGPMESIRAYGAIPVYSWSSQSIPSHLSEPDFQLGDVIAGTYDSYIRKFAEAAKAWGHPFFLRFNWEMNGSWFPWSEGANGNRPGEFVAAWRHVHEIFAAAGADQVTWVWCPNVDPESSFQDLASLYPGDDYVDWTGLDGYNWGLNPAKPDRWRGFDELFSATYQRIVATIAPDKPMMIGEIGSTEQGGSKAGWIEEALAAIPTAYAMIRGLVWFDTYDDGMDWPIETSASSAGAFAQAIKSPAYVEKGGPTAASGPIAPPN